MGNLFVDSGYCDDGYLVTDYVRDTPVRTGPLATLTDKLLGYLHRVFDKDAHAFLALRFRYDGAMAWRIEDNTLSTDVVGGSGVSIEVDLSQHTLSSLIEILAEQPGYTVEYFDPGMEHLSSCVLVSAIGNQDDSNGDHLYGYTSLLWAYMEPFAVELREADYQIGQAIAQMNLRKAEADWLDEWGTYYGIPRVSGELDPAYANRIIVEVLRPRGNNVAIEIVARELLGQPVVVNDIRLWGPATPSYNGVYTYNGAQNHNASASSVYGLFDVDYVYNLESGEDVSGYAAALADIVERVRDAGTHLRAINLLSSQISDTSSVTPVDSASITATYGIRYDGSAAYDGVAPHSGVSSAVLELS